MDLPPQVEALKPALRKASAVNMSGCRRKTPGRVVVPYDGEMVWLDPYLESDREMELAHARDEIVEGDEASAEGAFRFACDTLADLIFGWNLTDKFGEPLPQPDSGDAIGRLPSYVVLFLMNEALGVESEGEGSGA